MAWGTAVEQERRNRILLSIAAYAYEIENDPVMGDSDFDALAFEIKPEVLTGHPVLDEFFQTEFSPSTGMWIRKHPEIESVANRLHTLRRSLNDH